MNEPLRHIMAMLACSLSVGCAPTPLSRPIARPERPAPNVFSALEASAIMDHVQVLTNEKMRGRRSGTESEAVAREYIMWR